MGWEGEMEGEVGREVTYLVAGAYTSGKETCYTKFMMSKYCTSIMIASISISSVTVSSSGVV